MCYLYEERDFLGIKKSFPFKLDELLRGGAPVAVAVPPEQWDPHSWVGRVSPVAEEGGEGSDGGGDEEVVDEQPGRQGADGKLHPRAGK